MILVLFWFGMLFLLGGSLLLHFKNNFKTDDSRDENFKMMFRLYDFHFPGRALLQ